MTEADLVGDRLQEAPDGRRLLSAVLGCEIIEPGPDRPGCLRLQPLGSGRPPFINSHYSQNPVWPDAVSREITTPSGEATCSMAATM